MCISSEEINLLVQHYLQELGYDHTSFAFGCESKIPQKEIAQRDIPPGSLVYLVQKGIMYAQMESAAEDASGQPEAHFGHQLNILRASIRQSTEIAEELSAATRRLRILPSSEQIDPLEYYLSTQSSLFLEGHRAPITATAWSPQSDYFATGSTDGCVVIWEFKRDPKPEPADNTPKEEEEDVHDAVNCWVGDKPVVIRPNGDPSVAGDITALSWSPVDPVIAIGTVAGDLVICTKDGTESFRSLHEGPIVSVTFSPNGAAVASGSVDGSVKIIRHNKVVLEKKLENDLIDVQWIDNKSVISCCGRNIFKLSEDEEPKLIFTSEAPGIQLLSSTSGFALGDANGTVTVFGSDLSSKNSTQAHHGQITALSWSADGSLISGGADGSIRVLTKTGDPLTYTAAPFPIIGIAADPQQRYFAVAGANDILGLYSVEEKRLLLTFAAVEGITAISWSPNGRFLSVGLMSGQVSVTDFDQVC